jgi:hypothetical protein
LRRTTADSFDFALNSLREAGKLASCPLPMVRWFTEKIDAQI